MIALGSGLVGAIAVLLIIWRMIDGDLHVAAGFPAIILVIVAMAFAINPPHPAVPGVVLVVLLSLMVFFPYAEGILEEVEHRAIRAGQMARSFDIVRERPDNYVAKFQLAQLLHDHGFVAQAIYLASGTMSSLGTARDEVSNRSVQDMFYREQKQLERWIANPGPTISTTCPKCKHINKPDDFICAKCGTSYPLEIISNKEVRPKVMAKLVLAWGVLAVFIPVAVSVALNFAGPIRYAAFLGCVVAVGALFTWLFRAPRYA